MYNKYVMANVKRIMLWHVSNVSESNICNVMCVIVM